MHTNIFETFTIYMHKFVDWDCTRFSCGFVVRELMPMPSHRPLNPHHPINAHAHKSRNHTRITISIWFFIHLPTTEYIYIYIKKHIIHLDLSRTVHSHSVNIPSYQAKEEKKERKKRLITLYGAHLEKPVAFMLMGIYGSTSLPLLLGIYLLTCKKNHRV